jgi:hypothetical protein
MQCGFIVLYLGQPGGAIGKIIPALFLSVPLLVPDLLETNELMRG